MPVLAAQMSYVHMMGDITFVVCNFLKNIFSGHSTFVLSTIDIILVNNSKLTSFQL